MVSPSRADFDVPEHVAYLNAAYMGPMPRTAIEAGRAAAARKAQPWRLSPDDFFTDVERARTLAASLYNAPADAVALAPSASYGLATAARNLTAPAGSEILVLADQFPSHVYVWREMAQRSGASVVTVDRGAATWTQAVLARLSDRTAIVAVPQVHWGDGGMLDLVAIGRAAHDAGAALVLDLTQSLGAAPFDAAEVDPDFAIAATYKWLLGPYSMAAMYVAPRWWSGEPLEHNWIARAGSEDFTRLTDYTDAFQPGARRFDVGERSNFALLPPLIAALEYIRDADPAAIAERLGALTRVIEHRLAPFGLSVPPNLDRAPHYLCLDTAGVEARELSAALAQAEVYTSVRGGRLRVTPHVYTSEADIDRLEAAVGAMMRERTR